MLFPCMLESGICNVSKNWFSKYKLDVFLGFSRCAFVARSNTGESVD